MQMGWKSKLIYPFAIKISKQLDNEDAKPIAIQKKIFNYLIQTSQNTEFGRAHDFKSIKNYEQFKNRIPLNKYVDISHHIEKIAAGEPDVLWPGRPKYFVGTSGTTSGIKYIPLTKESMPYHFGTARNATFSYCVKNGLMDMFDGKMIFLSGSPELYKKGVINTGRLSGIMNKEIPSWLRSNQIPTHATNCIEDWEEKIKQIVLESYNQNMTMISGITPWIIMYAEYLLDYTKKETVKQLFPNLKLIIHGGVNFGPYQEKLQRLVGSGVKYLETYPASEGFIASQITDNQDLRLNINGGVFFEFIKADQVESGGERISLAEVELDKNYAIVLNNNAGFFSYLLGDTVKFVNLEPYRLVVTGRLSQFISAFGEHVIVSEVERALQNACKQTGVNVNEFSVAPNIPNNNFEKAFHEWFIEFEDEVVDLQKFESVLDVEMQAQNFQYEDLIKGKVIKPLEIRPIIKNGFRNYMKSIGKLGGQNKVPKLNNTRIHANSLTEHFISSTMKL